MRSLISPYGKKTNKRIFIHTNSPKKVTGVWEGRLRPTNLNTPYPTYKYYIQNNMTQISKTRNESSLCPYCKIRPLLTRKRAKTCGEKDCQKKHRVKRTQLYIANRYTKDPEFAQRYIQMTQTGSYKNQIMNLNYKLQVE